MGERNFPKGSGIHDLKVIRCVDGGLLYEFFREEGFGQLAVRTVKPGVTVGGHCHPITNESWTFYKGSGVVYLEYENGIREMRHIDTSGGPVVVPLPAGTGHDVRAIGDEDLIFVFFADRIYDSETHDKEEWEW